MLAHPKPFRVEVRLSYLAETGSVHIGTFTHRQSVGLTRTDAVNTVSWSILVQKPSVVLSQFRRYRLLLGRSCCPWRVQAERAVQLLLRQSDAETGTQDLIAWQPKSALLRIEQAIESVLVLLGGTKSHQTARSNCDYEAKGIIGVQLTPTYTTPQNTNRVWVLSCSLYQLSNP